MDFTKNDMLELLHKNVVPALGCTEPVCAAIAAADAANSVGGNIQSIALDVSPGVYKNGCSVGIAGFDRVGLDYAAALGALISKPEVGLEIMKHITPAIAQKAKDFVAGGKVKVTIAENAAGVYAHCRVETPDGYGESTIQGNHTNIIKTTVNGISVFEKLPGTVAPNDEAMKRLQGASVLQMREIASSASDEELQFLLDGVTMNTELARYGLRQDPGIGIAGVLHMESGGGIWGNGLIERVVTKVAAATEARLEGCPYATMSSAGSGSKGIAVILPVVETAKEIEASQSSLLHALAFGHTVLSYLQKRKNILDGTVITGGEPLLWPDLSDFLCKARGLGYKIKLDTNGSFPERLKELLALGLIDYVAMDVKQAWERYETVSGVNRKEVVPLIQQSLYVLADSGVPFELRTTVVKGIHTLEDMTALARWIGNAAPYYLQPYESSGHILSPEGLSSFSEKELKELLSAVQCDCPSAALRK